MKNKTIIEKITIALTFILSITAVTIAFAAYTSNLNIKGTANIKAARWRIIFVDLKNVEVGNTRGMTVTAKEIAKPSIVDEISIESYEVELKTPGDYIAYHFKIKNDGDLPAEIATDNFMPTPVCTNGENGLSEDATNVCNNLEYTLTYVNDDPEYINRDIKINAKDRVKRGDKYTPGLEREVELKLYYKQEVTENELPLDDVKISNLNITIPFIQY